MQRGIEFVGCDVVEVSPPFDSSTGITSLHGATVMYEQLCLLADVVAGLTPAAHYANLDF